MVLAGERLSDDDAPPRAAPAVAALAPARRPPLGIRAGQIVTAQAAAALLVVSTRHGSLAVLGAAIVAAALVLVAWLRLRRRWLFEWIAVGARYLTRRRVLAPDAGPAALLDLLAPGTALVPAELAGDAAAVLTDGYGLTAVLELGDPAGLLVDAARSLPSPGGLLPAATGQTPPTRIQLLLTGAPAPTPTAGVGAPANSYRQLTGGRLLGHERALLAVRVSRTEGWSDEDLRRALSSTVRKVRRRLAPVPARPLGESAALRVLAEAAHHDGAQPVAESWQSVRLGGLSQATFRLRGWPDPQADGGRRLVPRLLALPAVATTVSVGAGPRRPGATDLPVELTVRLAAADPGALAVAVGSLRRLLTAERAHARRLDGEHLDGVASTLPLGTAGPGPLPRASLRVPVAALDNLDLSIGAAGLMIGANRHGAPVGVRLFRAEPTRVVLVGGFRAAQLVALRAMALGARVVVQSARPQVWEPFVRAVSRPGHPIPVVPPGRPITGLPSSPPYPLLFVVDAGPVAADTRPATGWYASLVVRDELTATDVDALSRADLVLLQPLRPREAALAGAALGLGGAAEWLTRIRDDMVAVVNRRSLRWALLTATAIETQLIGPPARY